MNETVSISKDVMSIGGARFIRGCALPMIADLEEVSSAAVSAADFKQLQTLQGSGPQAGPLTTTFVAALVGVGGWLCSKILSDIYAETLGKKIRACIKRSIEHSPKNSNKCVGLIVGNFQDGSTVVIAALGSTEQELSDAECKIPAAIAAISSLPLSSAGNGAVYLYRLSSTMISLEPEVHESVKSAILSIIRPVQDES